MLYALAATSGLGLLIACVLPNWGESASVLGGHGDESGEDLCEALARMEEGHVQEGAVDCSRAARGWAFKEAWASSDKEAQQFYLRCHVRIENTKSLIINGLPEDDLQSVAYNMDNEMLIGEVLVGPFDAHAISWRAVSTAVGKACGVQGKFRRRRICFSYQPCSGAVEVDRIKVEDRRLARCLLADMMLT